MRQQKIVLPALVIALAIAGIFIFTKTKSLSDDSLDFTGNPEKFYLIMDGTTVSYNFRYDPLAMDQWMFRMAGRRIETQPANLPSETNRFIENAILFSR